MSPDPAPSAPSRARLLWRVAVAVELAVVAGVAGWAALDAARPRILDVEPAAGDRVATEAGAPVVLSVAVREGLPGSGVARVAWVADRESGTVPGADASQAAPIAPAAAQPTPTYDGSGQANHPSVIDFLAEYGMRSWGGHRYWMVMTPYPGDAGVNEHPSADQFENPSLLVSDDGSTWTPPQGLRTPLAGPPADYRPLAVHFSDPELVYDPRSDSLDVYYRENRGREATAAEVLHRVDVSARGGSFTTTVHPTIQTGMDRDNELVSPGVVLDGQGRWHMWFVSMYPEGGSVHGTGTLRILHETSPDGLAWSAPASCTPSLSEHFRAVPPRPGRYFAGGDPLYPWHLDAKRTGDTVRLLIDTTLERAKPSLGRGSSLYLAQTTLADPTRLTFPADGPLVTGTDSTAIYRASFVPGATDRVWYSARDLAGAFWSPKARWRIAFTEGRIEGGEWAPASSVTVPLDLAPGEWWFHVRAAGPLGVWSETRHVKVVVPAR